MGLRTWVWTIGVALIAAQSAHADRIAAEEPFLDPAQVYNQDYFWLRRATGVVVPDQNRVGLDITFPDYQSAIGRRVLNPMDWSQYDYIQMKATNNDPLHSMRANLVIQTSSDPTNYNGSFNVMFSLAAGETRNMLFPLKVIDPRNYGIRRLPPVLFSAFSTVGTGNQNYNLATVYHWRISYQESYAGSLSIREFRLMKYNDSLVGLADRFGQYSDRNWDSKITQESDFASRLASEDADLAANPGPGEAEGSRRLRPLNEAPKWRMYKRVNKWFMVHPSGRLFWSLGLNGVTDLDATVVEGREDRFVSLPDQAGPFGDLYSVENTNQGPKLTYNFFKQNLREKYGTDYMAPFAAKTRQRLNSWGINTIGSWSNPVFYDGSIPFTMYTNTADFPDRLPCPYVHANDLPDAFDPDFSSYLATKFQATFGPFVNRRNFMGVMVDNELSWGWDTSNALRYNVALGALNAPVNQSARVEFRRQLRNKYGTIEALNAAWGTSFASWNAFATTNYTPSSYPNAMVVDMRAFVRSFAAAYYGKVKAALNSIGYRGLYLGSRFYPRTTEVLYGGAKYVDVYTVNTYGSANLIDWPAFNSWPKPVIVSEFSFGLQEDGNLGGPAETASRSERYTNVRDFVQLALRQWNVVGVHWFEYLDHPVTGRFYDGENYGIGFLDIADNPHQEVIDAFRETTADMYRFRVMNN